ncbi:MAG TPA: hypothetical protein DDW20_02660 [Firmicutes bacterium]|nr:hypothetical protein [Bacillota bacterium]
MMYLTVKFKLTGEFFYMNTPVLNANFGKYMTDVKMLSGKWVVLNHLYNAIIISNEPIRGLEKC